MRKSFFTLFSGFLSAIFVALAVLSPVPVFAQENGDVPSDSATAAGTILPVEDTATLDRSPKFFADSTVQLNEVYYGPVFVAGGQVSLDGEVYGDLVVAGGTVRIDGVVHEDIYAAGGTVVVGGQVEGNVIAAGGEVTFTESSEVQESVILAGERVVLAGAILHDAWLGASEVHVDGAVQGDVQTEAETLSLGEAAFVGGMLRGKVSEPVAKSDSSEVAGSEDVQVREVKQKEDPNFGSWLMGLVINVVSFSIVMGVLVAVFGPQIAAVTQKYADTRVSSFGWGTLTLAALSIGALFLLITVVGWKATVLSLTAFVAAVSLGWVIVAAEVGQRLLVGQARWMQFVLGGALLGLVTSIPFFGPILVFVASIYGVGVVVRGVRHE
ncbi:EI24 domain-containing protein [Candidatus Woesebacteria bacterium]|nr:EI24 domain-containing protein [Candidatus Woesebacteria bacterium]